MLAKQALNSEIQPLFVQNSVSEAAKRMNELNISAMPVIDRTTKKLIGQVELAEIESVDGENVVADLVLEEAIKTYLGQHIFEAARLMLQYEMRLLPVVDKEQTFQGFLGKDTVLESLTHMLNLSKFGSVITIELNQRDFTLAEIVHLVESESAKVLGITVEMPETHTGNFEVSIKLNLKDVSRVAASLRRHDYTVVTNSSNEILGMDVETRADELIKYLDM